ncbi:MAG: hypothetical protein U0794_14810 [Isosphaeraceae bacterium]
MPAFSGSCPYCSHIGPFNPADGGDTVKAIGRVLWSFAKDPVGSAYEGLTDVGASTVGRCPNCNASAMACRHCGGVNPVSVRRVPCNHCKKLINA